VAGTEVALSLVAIAVLVLEAGVDVILGILYLMVNVVASAGFSRFRTELHPRLLNVGDPARAHPDAPAYLRCDASTTLNCGYGKGCSALDVIDTVKRVPGVGLRSR
jgi:hypothetical protein